MKHSELEAVFRHIPAWLLVLRADEKFTIVDATDEWHDGTMTHREDIIGRGLFEAFPDNPDNPETTGVSNLRASLEHVVATGKPDVMDTQRYDIPRPPGKGGGFEERYWSPENVPVADEHGNVTLIVHKVRDVTASVISGRGEERARAELEQAESRYRAVVENVPAITYTATATDPLRILFVSPQFRSLGLSPEDWQQDPDLLWRYTHPDDRDRIEKAWQDFRREGGIFDAQFRFECADGNTLWLRSHAQVVGSDGGHFVQGVISDISQYKHAEAALRVANRRLTEDIERRQRIERALFAEKQRVEVTLGAIDAAVIAIDADGRVDYANPAAESELRLTEDDLRDHLLVDVLAADALSDDERHELQMACAHGGRFNADLQLRQPDGTRRIMSLSLTPVEGANRQPGGAVAVLQDVTEERLQHEHLAYQARHDDLTGLPNRDEFETRLRHALDSAGDLGVVHVLLFIDLDDFKRVNDTAGHAAGDALLRELPHVMSRHIRGRDTLARIGGDEFACLLERCSVERGIDIARAILAAVRDYTLNWDSQSFSVGASIGVVPLDEHGISIEEALQAGDAACYAVKEAGRNDLRVRQPRDTSEQPPPKRELDRLLKALGEDRFELFTQPITRLADGQVQACEVLLRLVDDGKRIPAAAFMPTAERHRLAVEIDRWVIRKAFATLASHEADERVYYFNVSAAAIEERQLADYIAAQLRAFGLPPARVGFDISEPQLVAYPHEAIEFARAVKALGCHVALDGFDSAFSLARQFEDDAFDLVKLSNRLVSGADTSRATRALLVSANTLFHTMGSATVAKWPETADDLDLLLAIGVDHAQGNFFSQPQPI